MKRLRMSIKPFMYDYTEYLISIKTLQDRRYFLCLSREFIQNNDPKKRKLVVIFLLKCDQSSTIGYGDWISHARHVRQARFETYFILKSHLYSLFTHALAVHQFLSSDSSALHFRQSARYQLIWLIWLII